LGHWYWEKLADAQPHPVSGRGGGGSTQAGVVSLLTDGPVARPGHVDSKDPLDEHNATDFLQQVVDMRRGVDVLLERKDVDPKRIAFVGHSYNAGSVGALLSGVDSPIQGFLF